MRVRDIESFPHAVEVLAHVPIPLSDGTTLSAKIWLPDTAATTPAPAILEYIPYRKRDLTSRRDAMNHAYFAGHGYASVRVDIRGSGDSEGVLTDEYLEQELRDGEEILEWMAAQPWCNGRIGMIGISWGGFNGLQLAARQPPELKAVITVCSTDDRYSDDVHYMGGCLLGDNLSWASSMFAHTSLPPDPAVVGEKWREMWKHRLEDSGLWLETWLQHQARDAYWKHGSICEDYSAVKIPVFAVSGWADGYSNSIFRMLDSLAVPRKGLIGPWSHKYPHMGIPGPAVGFLQEAVRWWDQWLKGMATGIMDEPMLRVWMQERVPPTFYTRQRPGRWVAEQQWPSPHIEPHAYVLGDNRLLGPRDAEACAPAGPLTVQSPLSVGLFAGKWCSFTATPDLPHDQREEDGGALVFDSAPLPERLEVLGAPLVDLEFSVDKPVGMVAARLSSLAPDDKATRITFGLLNLCHRNGHESPEFLQPGVRYRVRVRMNEIAQVFPKGHSLRVAVSTSYWPLAWAPPESFKLTVYPENSRLLLPVRPPRDADQHLPAFSEPEAAPPPSITLIQPRDYHWRVVRDLARDISTLEVVKDEGVYRIEDIDLEVRSRTVEYYSYNEDDFASVRGETQTLRRFRRDGWDVQTVTKTVLSCTPTSFRIDAELDAYEAGRRIHCASWNREVPRYFV